MFQRKSFRMFGSKALTLACAATFLLIGGGSAVADEAAEAPKVAEADTAAVECPALTRAKYPFLSCERSESGAIVLKQQGPGMRGQTLEFTDGFVIGGGYYGGRD